MFDLFLLWSGALIRLLRSRRELALENLALRQQLGVLKRRHPRPNLGTFDRLFWVVARRVWFGWKQSLIIVTPETVVGWHRAGFRLYWRLISRARRKVGRKPTSKEVRDLIFRMVAENPTWGAPRIHGELLMLCFDISERTVSRWMKRAPRDPQLAKRWLAFLRNHREAIAAMDFFTVPTITFGALYCFFIIGHDRRRILHFNVTKHPTSLWIVQQLREAFPFELVSRFLIFDRDAKYGLEVPVAVRSMGVRPVRTSFESPWQNGVAERWVEKLPTRPTGSHHCAERKSSEAIALGVSQLLPRGPHTSWTGEGNAQLQDSFKAFRSRTFSHATRRIASSLRSGCLTLRFSSETARPNSILIYMPAVRSNCCYRQSRRRGRGFLV